MPEINIIVVEDSAQLAVKGAEIFCRAAKTSIKQAGRLAVAVSGGSTPRAMHQLLTREPYVAKVPWQQTHLFWVDERMVPFEHPASNFGAAKKDFLEKVAIPAGNIHPMPAWADPEQAVKLYREELNTFFKPTNDNYPVFDLIFLGIGTDGHTASLFPKIASADTEAQWVLAVKGGSPDVFRLTLSYSLLNQGRQVVFLVSGNEKAKIVKKILEKGEPQLPAQKIKPKSGVLQWLLDRDAAALLSKEQLTPTKLEMFKNY